MGVHVFPILNPRPTSLPIPSLWVIQCINPKHPVSCIEPGLAIFFTYNNIYMFQCHSPISSHPPPLPQSPKDCSIHLCLFCCLAYRVIITIFLNPIYMVSILYWCFSFWLTSLCIIGSSFIHLIRTDANIFFLVAD